MGRAPQSAERLTTTPPVEARHTSVPGWIAALALLGWAMGPAWAAPFAYIAVTIDNDFECTLPTQSAVAVIDTATNAIVATVPVPRCPAGVAVHPAGTFVYVTTDTNSVSVIDTATNTVTATVPLAAYPIGVAVHPAGTFLYVTAGTGSIQTLSVIATATNTVVATVPVGTLPTGVAVHPAGTFVYVTNLSGGTVSVIASATNTVVATVPVGTLPTGVVVHPAGTFVYVANRGSGTVSVIDAATNNVVATVPVGASVSHVAVHPAGAVVYVTTDIGVAVIGTATNSVVATVPATGFPLGVAVHPAGTYAYTTNLRSATVSVIDTATNGVVATVAVGDPPTTFGQFVGPADAGASLTLNQGAFRPGHALTLSAVTYVGSTARRVDAYAEVRLPDHSSVFLQSDGTLTREARPIAGNWPVAAFSGAIFQQTFTGAEPSGSYEWLGYFTEPGTSRVVGLVSRAPFTFGP